VTISGGAVVSLSSSGTVSELSLNGGATLSLGASGNRFFRTTGLFLDSSKLNLHDNDLIVDYTGDSPIGSWDGLAYTGITGMIQSGRNGGAWNSL
jgi:hypothetical protein